MRKRTLARELALKALYQFDVLPGCDLKRLEAFCQEYGESDVRPYALELIRGCISRLDEIDRTIESVAENWNLARMAVIDRNLLRLGAYELVYLDDVPPKVTINEAIELAKRYSTEQSGVFVNGILDRILEEYAPPAKRRPVEVETQPSAQAREEGRADLHAHTDRSDGSLKPAELVRLAREAGLCAVAVTDHDSVSGVDEALAEAAVCGIEVVPGVEFTTYWQPEDSDRPVEIHILGLFVDHKNPWLVDELDRLRAARRERLDRMIRSLARQGLALDREKVLRDAGESAGRAHLARALVEAGHCATMREAFDRYVGLAGPAWEPKETLPPAGVLRLIRVAGGVSVLAHPMTMDHAEEVMRMLAAEGLDAIEAYAACHGEQDRATCLEWAARFDLAVSGGSDFHGDLKPDVQLGAASIPASSLEKLRSRAGAR